MQVMQSNEFDKTEVLVGQVSATESFGVSDDPTLMSMLSTGFYGNPLRTMIQEIMFNAWDAHRMGDCLDKPIDVYINEGTGLIIRDYGPGIPDSDIHGVYCVYGASTKRADKRQTGGFGLGSKSPFSYSESFTVTSMNQHRKCMYLISRVSEDGGKPGRTRLLDVATTESGLMVTVPLLKTDYKIALAHIKDVLFLSGIKANIHFMDHPQEQYKAISLTPGEYILADTSVTNEKGLYAVYGGVRYKIPVHEDYGVEYNFLVTLSLTSNLYIGFASDTLTPLPNREGLNMSQKCRDAIRIGLELCMERFCVVTDPLLQAFLRQMFDELVKREVQPQFAMYYALQAHSKPDQLISIPQFCETMTPLVPLNTDLSMWKIGLKMLKSDFTFLINVIGQKAWLKNLVQHFIRVYPDHKEIAFAVMKKEPIEVLHNGYGKLAAQVEELISDIVNPGFFKDLYLIENQMKQLYEDETLHMTFRINPQNIENWVKLTRKHVRSHTKYDKSLNKNVVIKSTPTFESPISFYEEKTTERVTQMFITKTIFLAKTAASLSQTYLDTDKAFQKGPTYNKFTHHYYNYSSNEIILGCVVYSRNGAYKAAKDLFTAAGYNVIEAKEPEKVVKTDGVKKEPTQYYTLDPNFYAWANSNLPIEDPTHVLYMTLNEIKDDNYYKRKAKPSRSLIRMMLKVYPKTVSVNNVTQQNALLDRGVITFEKGITDYVSTLVTKKYRLRNIVRATKIIKHSNLPIELLKLPVIQKAVGMVPIDPSDLEQFWSELEFYSEMYNCEYHSIQDTVKSLQKTIDDTWKSDPQKDKILQKILNINVFSESNLKDKWKGLRTPEDQDAFLGKLVRFIRED